MPLAGFFVNKYLPSLQLQFQVVTLAPNIAHVHSHSGTPRRVPHYQIRFSNRTIARLSNKPGEWPVRKHFPATALARLAFIPDEFWHVFLKFADSQAKSRDCATSAPFRFRHFSSLMPKAISQISAFLEIGSENCEKAQKSQKSQEAQKSVKSRKSGFFAYGSARALNFC